MTTTKKNLKDLPTAEEVLKQKRAAAKRVREEAKKTKDWNDRMTKALVGKKIVGVRYMTSEEAGDWYKLPLMIFLSDGSLIIPSQDDEQNDGGSLIFHHEEKDLEEGVAPVMWKD